jgi:hypothetical protein
MDLCADDSSQATSSMHVTYSVYGAGNCSARQGGDFNCYEVGRYRATGSREERDGRMGFWMQMWA